MKKIMILSLIITATLMLAACAGGGNENNLPANENENTVANSDGNNEAGGNENTAENNNTDSGGFGNSDSTEPEESVPVVGLGACQNIYYPISEGPVYTYSIASDFETVIQTISFTEVSPDGFISVMDVEEIHSEIHWDCSAAGMVSAEYAQFNVFPGADVTVETIDISGIVIPAEENMVVGYAWDAVFTMRVTMNLEGVTTVADVVIDEHLEIVGQEAVTVPAGEYPEALLVQITTNMSMNMSVAGAGAVAITNDYTGTAHYVAGVGLVKQTGTFESYNTLMELIFID